MKTDKAQAPKEPKKEMSLHELDQTALMLVKQDKTLTEEIDARTEDRNKLRKELRGLNGRIVTRRQQEQLKKVS